MADEAERLAGMPVPIFDGDTRTGTLLVKRVPEGYEARAYRLPTGRSGTVPIEDLDVMWAGLYDLDRNLIRPLDA